MKRLIRPFFALLLVCYFSIHGHAQVLGTGTVTGTFTDNVETASAPFIETIGLPPNFSTDDLLENDGKVPLIINSITPFPIPVSTGAGTSSYQTGLDSEGQTVTLEGEQLSIQELINIGSQGDSPGGTLTREFGISGTGLSYTAALFDLLPQGETFVAGTLEYSNGAGFLGSTVPSVTLTLESFSDDIGFTQTLDIPITLVTTINNDSPEESADFIFFSDRPELGSFRVFEGESTSVEVLAEFNSLDLIGFGEVSDPTVGFVSNSIGVPEPSGGIILLVAASLSILSRRRLVAR